jgi:hypothetical protein
MGNGYWLFASLLVFGHARARIPERSGVLVATWGKKISFWFLAVAKANRHKQMICVLYPSNGHIPFQASGPGRKYLGSMPPSHPHRLVSRSPAPWLVLIVAVDRWFVRSLLALPRPWLLLLCMREYSYVCVTVTGGRGGARREREASRGLRRHKSTAGTLTGSWRFLRGTGRDLLPIRIL